MRYTKRTFAALVCAFALLPAGSALAGSGPAPSPSEWEKPKSAAPSATGNPLSKKAKAAAVCSDAKPIGEVRYIDRGGVHIASVKQFHSASCKENYGYLWVWDSFRQNNKAYDITVAVYSYTQDEVLGKRSWTNTSGQEYWSQGTKTSGECTAGVGSLRRAGDPLPGQAASTKKC
ncbi:hypothetical protein LHJ74_28765 [Streptomyces sp. N2-109]|uniref:Secreted protein n=1 Tax=Streptomyces gossypii TaxID=2883101 RepID=A0ABT2K108_9ACTN|nr:hypothetical protein [Streptomyces gossypii]MCT2593852.1 hypothetical protein [Streptomyces gossypii]